jgi:hypothetical protein
LVSTLAFKQPRANELKSAQINSTKWQYAVIRVRNHFI